MANITQEVSIDMLEKLPDGNFKIKYPKTKANQVLNLDKVAVGLGSVQNYGIATTAEAKAGTSNVKYMTPLRVKEAIIDTVGGNVLSSFGEVSIAIPRGGSTETLIVPLGKVPNKGFLFVGALGTDQYTKYPLILLWDKVSNSFTHAVYQLNNQSFVREFGTIVKGGSTSAYLDITAINVLSSNLRISVTNNNPDRDGTAFLQYNVLVI